MSDHLDVNPSAPLPSTSAQAEPLARLFAEHVDAVFGFLVTRCGSRSVAEDVASETFAEAARAFSVGRGETIGRGWLIDVAK